MLTRSGLKVPSISKQDSFKSHCKSDLEKNFFIVDMSNRSTCLRLILKTLNKVFKLLICFHFTGILIIPRVEKPYTLLEYPIMITSTSCKNNIALFCFVLIIIISL